MDYPMVPPGIVFVTKARLSFPPPADLLGPVKCPSAGVSSERQLQYRGNLFGHPQALMVTGLESRGHRLELPIFKKVDSHSTSLPHLVPVGTTAVISRV